MSLSLLESPDVVKKGMALTPLNPKKIGQGLTFNDALSKSAESKKKGTHEGFGFYSQKK